MGRAWLACPARLACPAVALAGLALIGAVLGTVACAKGVNEPVVPPAQSTPSGPPRVDGIYAAKVEAKGDATAATAARAGAGGGVNLLRFTKDGKVQSLSVGNVAALESAVKALLAGTDKAASGTYVLKSGVLRFTLTSKLGSVEYAGGAKDDQLSVRWRSAINGATVEESFEFVKMAGDEAAEGAGDKADKPSDSRGEGGAPPALALAPSPAPGTVPPDATLVPSGSAWLCFRAPTMNTSRCERTMAACESAYRDAATAHRDVKLTKCAKRAGAYCHTAQKRGSGRGFCYQAEDECKAGAAGLEGPELVISTCEKF